MCSPTGALGNSTHSLQGLLVADGADVTGFPAGPARAVLTARGQAGAASSGCLRVDVESGAATASASAALCGDDAAAGGVRSQGLDLAAGMSRLFVTALLGTDGAAGSPAERLGFVLQAQDAGSASVPTGGPGAGEGSGGQEPPALFLAVADVATDARSGLAGLSQLLGAASSASLLSQTLTLSPTQQQLGAGTEAEGGACESASAALRTWLAALLGPAKAEAGAAEDDGAAAKLATLRSQWSARQAGGSASRITTPSWRIAGCSKAKTTSASGHVEVQVALEGVGPELVLGAVAALGSGWRVGGAQVGLECVGCLFAVPLCARLGPRQGRPPPG